MSDPRPESTRVVSFETTASVPLTGDVPLSEVLARVGDDYTRKGFFFRKHVRALGEGFPDLRPKLDAPPALGTYVPFADYPSRDYFRVLDAAARLRFPQLPMAEAHRRFGREELGAFLEFVVARVAWASFDDPMAVFVGYTEISRRVMSRPHGHAKKMGERWARVEYTDPVGSVPYGVGVFEGVVLAFKQHPRVAVSFEGDRLRYDVRWTL